MKRTNQSEDSRLCSVCVCVLSCVVSVVGVGVVVVVEHKVKCKRRS
jgi:hypothetical protein